MPVKAHMLKVAMFFQYRENRNAGMMLARMSGNTHGTVSWHQ